MPKELDNMKRLATLEIKQLVLYPAEEVAEVRYVILSDDNEVMFSGTASRPFKGLAGKTYAELLKGAETVAEQDAKKKYGKK